MNDDRTPAGLSGLDPLKISEEQAAEMLRAQRELVLRGLGVYAGASSPVSPIAREDVRPPDWSAR